MRARLWLRVCYDAPAFDCRRVLRILPLGHLPIENEKLLVSPPPAFQEERPDRFGNRVLHLRHERVDDEFSLSLDCQVVEGNSAAPVERAGLAQWKLPSRAVAFTPELLELAHQARGFPAKNRAEHLCQLVHKGMEYTPDTTPRPQRAADVWQQKHGSCADFAHVLLALGRASGLPARYVAGFGPAPGSLHAWVEFGIEGHWQAFDPTHGRRATGLYLPVAIGRDFYDCAPHQGSFRGGNARLEMHCEIE